MLLSEASLGRYNILTLRLKTSSSTRVRTRNTLGNRASEQDGTQEEKCCSEGPSALPGIRTPSLPFCHSFGKTKGLHSKSLPSSNVQCFSIQDNRYMLINRKTKLNRSNKSQIKTFSTRKTLRKV